ncbi:type I secretion outer membrane protein, TolC family [Enterobacteriaceae bacterium strain FGI 57]|nr:type I secretion outer membrane protein, TolC family [Enterobacteriaceae bacterium strain FGI 57]
MKKRDTVMLALSLPLFFTGSAHALTLEQAIKNTLNTHPEVSASINSRYSADYDLKAARGGYLPSLNLNAGTGWEQTDNATTRAANDHRRNLHRSESSLMLTQNVFNGFATTSEVARQKATVNSRAYGVSNSSETTALSAIQVYMDVLMRQQFVKLAEENLASHERIFDQINLRTQQGVGRQADYEQAEARLAQARNNLLTEQTNLEDARTNFFSITGSEAESLNQPAPVAIPGTLEDARKVMLNNSPLLKLAESDVEATRQQYEASKSTFYPNVNIEAGRTMDNNIDGTRGHSQEWQAMLRMRYNLFNGGTDKANLTSNAYKLREAQDVRNNAQRQLTEELRLSWNALKNAQQQVPIAQQYADQSYKVRDAYRQQFSIGERTLLDLLDSENEVFTAQRRNIEMQYVELFSGYRIKARTGELLKSMSIQPPSASEATWVEDQQSLPDLK